MEHVCPFQVHQWTFKNNGIAFRDEDWSRLKKIGKVCCVLKLSLELIRYL